MLRFAAVLLAGATFVAAQTTVTTDQTGGDRARDSMKQGQVMHGGMDSAHVRDTTKQPPMREGLDTARLGEKFRDAMDRCGTKSDSAREARRELREQMKDSMKVDSAKVMDQHRQGKRERLQGAIDALERSTDRIGAQVKNEAQERTQTRLTERRDELIQLQQKIRERKEAKTEDTDTETETTEAAE